MATRRDKVTRPRRGKVAPNYGWASIVLGDDAWADLCKIIGGADPVRKEIEAACTRLAEKRAEGRATHSRSTLLGRKGKDGQERAPSALTRLNKSLEAFSNYWQAAARDKAANPECVEIADAFGLLPDQFTLNLLKARDRLRIAMTNLDAQPNIPVHNPWPDFVRDVESILDKAGLMPTVRGDVYDAQELSPFQEFMVRLNKALPGEVQEDSNEMALAASVAKFRKSSRD